MIEMGRKDLYGQLFAGDTRFMCAVYAINAAAELCYCYVMFFTAYPAAREHTFYRSFYVITSILLIVLAAQMIIGIARKVSPFKRIPLLYGMAGIQLSVIVVDIVYAAVHGGWWEDGYVFMALELLFLAAYVRRLEVLKKAKREAVDG